MPSTLKGDWTPAPTFITPGDLIVTPSLAVGHWAKTDNLLYADFTYISSAFSHSTAAGALQVSGLPLEPINVANYETSFQCECGGISKAAYSQFMARASAGSRILTFDACGMGMVAESITAADIPSGGTLFLRGSIFYRTE